MAKPIIVIKAPNIDIEQLENVDKSIGDDVRKDYHVFVINSNSNDWQFECFYEDDFNGAKYEELKKQILASDADGLNNKNTAEASDSDVSGCLSYTNDSIITTLIKNGEKILFQVFDDGGAAYSIYKDGELMQKNVGSRKRMIDEINAR